MTTDLTEMIGNISRSLFPVQHLLSGAAYIIGIGLFISALAKLKKITAAGRNASENIFVPFAYILGAVALLYLPSVVDTLANTAFGVGNILQYSEYNPYNIQNSMGFVIQTAGLIWFVRGCVLLVQAGQPGVQLGPKGLAFLLAGILAMNFQNTANALSAVMSEIEQIVFNFNNYRSS